MSEPLPPAVARFSHQAMGTVFEIFIAGEEGSYAGQAAQAAFKEIDNLESLFSRFNPASEISQINRLKPGESLAVGVETFECLSVAERVRIDTSGAFDINVRMKAKYRSQEMLKRPRDGAFSSFTLRRLSAVLTGDPMVSGGPGVSGTGFEIEVVAGEDSSTSGLDLDLGGIGKGFALEKALDILKEWSIECALLHGGTSTVAALGSAPGDEGWPVGVGGGWPGAPREIRLMDKALSGSGTEVKGRHIIDSRTGGPAAGHLAAWAAHPSAAVADALSTAFMVMSTQEVEDYCGRHPDVWSLVVKSYGDIRTMNDCDMIESR